MNRSTATTMFLQLLRYANSLLAIRGHPPPHDGREYYRYSYMPRYKDVFMLTNQICLTTRVVQPIYDNSFRNEWYTQYTLSTTLQKYVWFTLAMVEVAG